MYRPFFVYCLLTVKKIKADFKEFEKLQFRKKMLNQKCWSNFPFIQGCLKKTLFTSQTFASTNLGQEKKLLNWIRKYSIWNEIWFYSLFDNNLDHRVLLGTRSYEYFVSYFLWKKLSSEKAYEKLTSGADAINISGF